MGLRKCGCEGEEGLTEDLVFPRVSPEPRTLVFLQVPFPNLMCVPQTFSYMSRGGVPLPLRSQSAQRPLTRSSEIRQSSPASKHQGPESTALGDMQTMLVTIMECLPCAGHRAWNLVGLIIPTTGFWNQYYSYPCFVLVYLTSLLEYNCFTMVC